MKSFILLALVISLFSYESSVRAAPYPAVVIHGIMDQCPGWNDNVASYIRDTMDGVCFCQEVGNGKPDSVLKSIPKQAQEACDSLMADPRVNQGLDLITVS